MRLPPQSSYFIEDLVCFFPNGNVTKLTSHPNVITISGCRLDMLDFMDRIFAIHPLFQLPGCHYYQVSPTIPCPDEVKDDWIESFISHVYDQILHYTERRAILAVRGERTTELLRMAINLWPNLCFNIIPPVGDSFVIQRSKLHLIPEDDYENTK